jgi:hypothetical protein
MGIQIYAPAEANQTEGFLHVANKMRIKIWSPAGYCVTIGGVLCEFSAYGLISSLREPERERCIEGHNRIHTHSRAVSAEDQFFFLAV